VVTPLLPKGTDMYEQTVVIWNEFELGVQFFVLNGDYTHLDGTYINTLDDSDSAEANKEQLYDIVYDEEGAYRIEMLNTFPHRFGMCYPAYFAVIQAGFVP